MADVTQPRVETIRFWTGQKTYEDIFVLVEGIKPHAVRQHLQYFYDTHTEYSLPMLKAYLQLISVMNSDIKLLEVGSIHNAYNDNKLFFNDDKFIVRQHDRYERRWFDVTGPLTKAEAQKIFDEKTNNGTVKHESRWGDYYKIFPANTAMVYDGN